MATAYLGILPRTMIWFLTIDTYSTYIILFAYNTLKREKQKTISPTDHLVLVSFVCPCLNRRAHYPILEKSSAQNITAFENQSKPHKLSDH